MTVINGPETRQMESAPEQQDHRRKSRGSWNPIARYTRWLHTMWPAGTVERLPEVRPDGTTNVPGVYVVGDLTGIPLLKFSADTGAKAVRAIAGQLQGQGARGEGQAKDSSSPRAPRPSPLDLIIVGAGVSGIAAALEAKKEGLTFEVLEGSEPFSTIINFPKGKPIYTYPTEMVPAGDLQFHAQVKEPPILAKRVIIAIGRSGNFRKLGVPGEDSGKVFNRLHDPKEHAGKNVLVVGGGDSALETAIAIAECGGSVTLSYRKPEFSRPKPDNVDKLNRLMADPM